jgi:hypothetical protein
VKHLILLVVLLMSPSCMSAKIAKPAAVTSTSWRAAASRKDLQRLRTWRDAFVAALAEARAGEGAVKVAAEGRLLEPDAALDNSEIPVGRYRCRTIKLGSAGSGGLTYIDYPQFGCRVGMQGDFVTFEKLTGSQRPNGRFYPAGTRRQIFLGTLSLGDESRALGYGRDPDRDMAGVLERIDVARWRLIFPYPRFESTLDVIELVPAP